LEQKRSERSKRPFLLMLGSLERLSSVERESPFRRLIETLSQATRETDVLGWQSTGTAIGAIFPELEPCGTPEVVANLTSRVKGVIQQCLTQDEFARLELSFFLFPEEWGPSGSDQATREALYSTVEQSSPSSKSSSLLKRVVDVVGSLMTIFLLAPVMLLIAVMIRLTSPGPVFFRQQRVGQFGERFTFLKFRSMARANDQSVHRDYMRRFISGQREDSPDAGGRIYKITHDERVTRVGRFLRRTSLDELPQLFNVLAGDMSLVGPRPPIPYELDWYQTWHRRRLLAVKPGITGLWQVSGRSRVGFDDMVRLDLQYASQRSIWLDLKILFKTPAAVLSGNGAY
jgi:exopolysaccharide biosynthesis polyprenyl glycosylphosphotransferase